eukprot:3388771-Pleurochrysis_carterae.AAC.1
MAAVRSRNQFTHSFACHPTARGLLALACVRRLVPCPCCRALASLHVRARARRGAGAQPSRSYALGARCCGPPCLLPCPCSPRLCYCLPNSVHTPSHRVTCVVARIACVLSRPACARMRALGARAHAAVACARLACAHAVRRCAYARPVPPACACARARTPWALARVRTVGARACDSLARSGALYAVRRGP